jgi:hypothetical protein
MVRELEARIADGGADSIATLAHGRIRQPHHRELGEPECDVDFYVDRIGFDAKDGSTAKCGEHNT